MNVPNPKKNPIKMNHDTESDLQLEEAFSNFRHGMRAWSEDELRRRPAMPVLQPARSPWHWLMAPAVSWAAAAALTLAAVGVPLGLHYHNAAAGAPPVIAASHAPLQPTQAAAQAADSKVEDDQLLDHVDTDIAQDAPDAMQPLASLMSSSSATSSSGTESSSGAN